MFLEDGKWKEADTYLEKALDIDPKIGEAYLGKLMLENRVKTRDQLKELPGSFENSDNYSKIVRFGDEKLITEVNGYISHITKRNEEARLQGIFTGAVNCMNAAKTEQDYLQAANTFKTISSFKNAEELEGICLELAESTRKDAIYYSAKSDMVNNTVAGYEAIIISLKTISGWKDADALIKSCEQQIKIKKAQEKADRIEAARIEEEKRIIAERKEKRRNTAIAIIVPAVSVCVAFWILLEMVIIPKIKYNNAVGKYGKEWVDTIINASNGDTITFGNYEQDNNTTNGKEAIEWIVLAKEGTKILVISKYGLDSKAFNSDTTKTTWANCTLRQWMNSTFLNNAFSPEEQSMIQSTKVSADKNTKNSTGSGEVTTDKVFLFSITEVEKYIDTDSERVCKPTQYAIFNGAYLATTTENCWWWLRSHGEFEEKAICVDNGGAIWHSGCDFSTGNICVRPAMWIDIGS